MKSVEYPVPAQAIHAMDTLGVVQDDDTVSKKLIVDRFGEAGLLMTEHLVPHGIAIHQNTRNNIALRAMSDARDKYSDVHVRAIIDYQTKNIVAQALTTRVLEELVQQAAWNGATQLATKLHIPGPSEKPEIALAVWDNGNAYPNTESLRAAYLEDAMHNLTTGDKIIKRSSQLDFSRYPTLAVLHAAFAFGGTFTAASGTQAIDVNRENPDSRKLVIQDHDINPIEGNITLIRVPHSEHSTQ